jgi:hypothetical protein
MIRTLWARARRWLAGAGIGLALLAPVMLPRPAEAWWGPGWGWHAGWAGWGWGWHPGIAIGLPPVVVGAPVYAAYPYAYAYPPAPVYPYGYPYHWVPAHVAPNGVWVAGHWEK